MVIANLGILQIVSFDFFSDERRALYYIRQLVATLNALEYNK